MIDFFEKTKGSISLFLALIMLPMMTVAGLIVDGARISAAKASLSGAGDLAKPLFFGSIAAVVVIAGVVIALAAGKKKKNDKEK